MFLRQREASSVIVSGGVVRGAKLYGRMEQGITLRSLSIFFCQAFFPNTLLYCATCIYKLLAEGYERDR